MFQLSDFSLVRVLVVSDALLLDRYWSGDTSRISPAASVPGLEECILPFVDGHSTSCIVDTMRGGGDA